MAPTIAPQILKPRFFVRKLGFYKCSQNPVKLKGP